MHRFDTFDDMGISRRSQKVRDPERVRTVLK